MSSSKWCQHSPGIPLRYTRAIQAQVILSHIQQRHTCICITSKIIEVKYGRLYHHREATSTQPQGGPRPTHGLCGGTTSSQTKHHKQGRPPSGRQPVPQCATDEAYRHTDPRAEPTAARPLQRVPARLLAAPTGLSRVMHSVRTPSATLLQHPSPYSTSRRAFGSTSSARKMGCCSTARVYYRRPAVSR